MRPSLQPSLHICVCREPENPVRAFTLTELLVVIAVTGLLAVMLLPALAGAVNKGGQAQCASNLRQIHGASMVYANENNNWLPIVTVGAANNPPTVINRLGGEHYTRYVFSGTANLIVPTNATPTQGSYQNLGYLYKTGLAGDWNIFFCPAQWGSSVGANAYTYRGATTNALTTDPSGYVRYSYLFNPRMFYVNPNLASGTGDNIARRYQKTSDLEPHKLFAVDYIEAVPGPGMSVSLIGHYRERGWNVLFTDGSVQFSQSKNGFKAITQILVSTETHTSYFWYDTIFNSLELDH
jgi:prepilin-type N-terminal cleavage/methylation domain-containing protein